VGKCGEIVRIANVLTIMECFSGRVWRNGIYGRNGEGMGHEFRDEQDGRDPKDEGNFYRR
jgi:hypothetical protein